VQHIPWKVIYPELFNNSAFVYIQWRRSFPATFFFMDVFIALLKASCEHS